MDVDNSEVDLPGSEDLQRAMGTLTADNLANIRSEIKDKIISSLLSGHILQICGPPMSGKSTLVKQLNPEIPNNFMAGPAPCYRCFKAAKRVTVLEEDNSEIDKIFEVSKLQVREEKITRDKFAANTLCFLGENEMAEEMLLEFYEETKNQFADHPEFVVLLNSLGLIEERAEARKYLDEALSIRHEYGWVHAHTALILIQLGILNFRRFPNKGSGEAIIQSYCQRNLAQYIMDSA